MAFISRVIKQGPAGLLMLLACIWPAHAEDNLEDKVKTAFVYNFAKFIDWPDAANAGTSEFDICIAGKTSLGETIHQSLQHKTIKDRVIRVRRIGWSTDQLQGCHMLYVNGSTSPDTRRLLDAAHSKPILTIGETENFTFHGGIIRFLIVDGKVRFSINQGVAERVGLNISAKLLNVAIRVQRNQSELNGAQTKPRYAAFS